MVSVSCDSPCRQPARPHSDWPHWVHTKTCDRWNRGDLLPWWTQRCGRPSPHPWKTGNAPCTLTAPPHPRVLKKLKIQRLSSQKNLLKCGNLLQSTLTLRHNSRSSHEENQVPYKFFSTTSNIQDEFRKTNRSENKVPLGNTWYVALLHLFSFSLQSKYFMVILE